MLARFARHDGQASVEHVGLVLLLALLLAALTTLAAAWIPDAVLRAICAGAGAECGDPGKARAGAAGTPASRVELVDRYVDAPLDAFLSYRASPDRDPRLDWSTDQCTAPVVGSTGASFDFTEACLRHDFGYRNYRRLGVFERRKAAVDDRFLADMRDHCATRPPSEDDRCLAWARIYYLAVRNFGHLAAATMSRRGKSRLVFGPMAETGTTSAARGGIDLGGTKIQAAVVNSRNRVLGEARMPTPHEGGPKDVADAMAEALLAAAASAGLEAKRLRGVGVGSPGSVDEQRGTVANAGNLPGWDGGYPLGPRLAEALGTEVRVGNDVQVATNAEASLGAGRDYDSLLGVFWGTGVGGGIVLDGKPWLGRGAAGEIGHMVVKRGGARCPCGRRGCMEAYAGRAAMEARARKLHQKGKKTVLFEIMERKGHDRLTSSVWEHALRDGDEMAEELLDRAVKALGAGIASAVNLLDPEAVVIGGGLGLRFGEPFVKRIEERMRKNVFADDRPPDVRLAELGDLGGAIGASLLVRGRG